MKVIDKTLMDELCAKAAASPRLRAHHNLHESLDAPIHRLIMAGVKGTYIRPHRHFCTQKTEFFTILRGHGAVLTFSDSGVIRHRYELVPGGKTVAVELEPNEWHTFFPLSDEVVVSEVKAGPYVATPEQDFAQWSPAEGTPEAGDFVRWFRVAAEGEAKHL